MENFRARYLTDWKGKTPASISLKIPMKELKSIAAEIGLDISSLKRKLEIVKGIFNLMESQPIQLEPQEEVHSDNLDAFVQRKVQEILRNQNKDSLITTNSHPSSLISSTTPQSMESMESESNGTRFHGSIDPQSNGSNAISRQEVNQMFLDVKQQIERNGSVMLNAMDAVGSGGSLDKKWP